MANRIQMANQDLWETLGKFHRLAKEISDSLATPETMKLAISDSGAADTLRPLADELNTRLAAYDKLVEEDKMKKVDIKDVADKIKGSPFQGEMRQWIEDSVKMAGTPKTSVTDGKAIKWKGETVADEVTRFFHTLPTAPSQLQKQVDALKKEINTMSYEYAHKAIQLIKASGCIELIHDEETLIWQASDRFEQDVEAAIDKAGTRVAITTLTGLVHNLATDIHNQRAVDQALNKASKRMKKERNKRNG